MEKINLVELLRNCPSGMELDCTLVENLYFDCINDSELDDPYPIQCYTQNGSYRTSIRFTEYGHYTFFDNSKCVIFPKGKTTWEGFHRPFKDGDIIKDGYLDTICIFKGEGRLKGTVDFYCGINIVDELHIKDVRNQDEHFGEINKYNFATEEEKQKLFDAIKENGYKWDEGTKTLEKLGKQKFKNGDIIVCENHWGPFISIFKENVTERNGFIGHCVLDVDDNKFKVKDSASYFNEVRFDIEEEKEQLFRAIKKNGYKWNPDNKTLEKSTPNPDKFDITSLKPFDQVLVRDFDNTPWEIEFFSRLLDGKHFKCSGLSYVQCIPYKGNEHLNGKKDDCDKFFRTWEKTGD